MIAWELLRGVQHIDGPLQVRYWGVRTPVTPAALTPMLKIRQIGVQPGLGRRSQTHRPPSRLGENDHLPIPLLEWVRSVSRISFVKPFVTYMDTGHHWSGV